MKTENFFKLTMSLVLLLTFSSVTADSSCTGGGTMYVCGKGQIMQAVQDADNNCEEFSTKKLVDVCHPDMKEYTIYE